MSNRRRGGIDLLSPEDRKLVLLAQQSLDNIATSGSPAEVFKALKNVTPVAGGMVGHYSPQNPEGMVTRDFYLSDKMVQGFHGSSREQLAMMFAPLFQAGAGELVPATKGLSPSVREQIKLWHITSSEGYGETAGYKVCDPEVGSQRFVFLTLALEGRMMFTPRDYQVLGVLQRPLYAALERLRVPFVPTEKLQMQVMEDNNQGYLLISPKSIKRCIEMNVRARVLVDRYAASAEVEADRAVMVEFAKKAVEHCHQSRPWVIVRKQGDGELRIRVHNLKKESHNIGEDVSLVTMEETLYPVEMGIFASFGFTPREMEIVQLLVDSEYTGKEIAEELGTSYHTVRTQIQKIREKAGVKSRNALAAKLKLLSRNKRS
jgi:DNA-binding CsgD family transcriptional regulator